MPSQPVPPAAADLRARVAAALDQAEAAAGDELALVEQAPVPTPPGFVAWRIVGTTGVTVLPALVLNVPARVWRGYRARVLTNLTGRCPLCEAVADVNVDPSHRAGWALLPVTVGVVHLPGCSTQFTDADRRWFDPRIFDPRIPRATRATRGPTCRPT